MSWKDDPRYKIAGWTGLGLFVLVIVIDLIFNSASWSKTLSQYVVKRSIDQPLFGLIVLGILIGLIIHWFYRPIKSWIKQWFGKD
jgi:hypothetical protein